MGIVVKYFLEYKAWNASAMGGRRGADDRRERLLDTLVLQEHLPVSFRDLGESSLGPKLSSRKFETLKPVNSCRKIQRHGWMDRYPHHSSWLNPEINVSIKDEIRVREAKQWGYDNMIPISIIYMDQNTSHEGTWLTKSYRNQSSEGIYSDFSEDCLRFCHSIYFKTTIYCTYIIMVPLRKHKCQRHPCQILANLIGNHDQLRENH